MNIKYIYSPSEEQEESFWQVAVAAVFTAVAITAFFAAALMAMP